MKTQQTPTKTHTPTTDEQWEEWLGGDGTDTKPTQPTHSPLPDRSTKKQWEDLANEALADSGYWKAEARKAQAAGDEFFRANGILTKKLAGTESPNESTETGEAIRDIVNTEQRDASHLNQPDSEAVKAYWKSKVGRCLGCSTEIAVDESYCPACTSFLLEVHAQHQTEHDSSSLMRD